MSRGQGSDRVTSTRARRSKSLGRSALPGALPTPASALVHREVELHQVTEILCRSDVRLVTLVGAPGAGKTHLALAAAEALRSAFSGGVSFIDLTTITAPERVLPAIAPAFGIRYVGQSYERLEQTIRRVVGDREVLLLVDNFEHVLPAATSLLELLAGCPRLKILVTSRAPLRVAAERQLQVLPLAVPDPRHLPSLAALSEVPAVSLFILRAQAVAPNWQLTATNAADVAELCVRLDGLPLALELAASRLRVLSPRAIVDQLGHTLDVLGGGEADRPVRHQALRAAIAWSYDLLPAERQQCFGALAVFVGGWTLEACSVLWHGLDAQPVAALEDLAALVDAHLVVRHEETDAGVRFRLLDTIHAFAWEQLTTSGEDEAARRRHALFFVARAEEAEHGFDGPQQASWLERLEQDRDNQRAALAWCTHAGDPEATSLGLRLGAALRFFWDVRGHLREGRAPLKELLAVPAARPPTAERARTLQSAAWLAYLQGDVADVDRLLAESLDICRALGDTLDEARALSILGTALALHTDGQDRASHTLSEALRLGRLVDDTWSMGFALFSLSLVEMKQGRLDEATRYANACREVSQARGNTFGVACALFRLGVVALARGEIARAVALQQESLHLNWLLRNQRVVALNLELVACCLDSSHEADRQARLFAAAEALFEATDYPRAPTLAAAHERGVAAARAQLGEAFAAVWREGRSLPLEEAVALGVGTHVPSAREESRAGGLSAREVQVACLVAEGLTDREVAARLGIGRRTVDKHLRHIFEKLQVRSRSALTAWVVRSGLAG